MKTLISWIVIVAILISTFPRAVFAIEPPPWFEGPDPTDPEPALITASPIMSALQETMTSNKLGVVSAVIPFTDDTGRFFEFRINFASREYQIIDASGRLIRSAVAPIEQALALQAAIKNHRSATAALAESTNGIAKPGAAVVIAVLALAAAIIAAIIGYLAYEHAVGASADSADQFQMMCSAQAVNATAANFSNTVAACPGIRAFTSGGRQCTVRAMETSSASGCSGALYQCVTQCG